MSKKLEVLGLTPDMEKYKMEGKEPEKAEFKPKSFEELKQTGEKRLEVGRDKVFSFKNKIKEGVSGLFSKIKGIGKETLKTVAASPEIVKYGKDLAEYKAGQAYEAVADKVESSVNATGEFVSETYRGAVDTAKTGYNKLENRAVYAYLKLQEKYEELQRKIDFEELILAQEDLFKAKERFNDLLIKNQMKWGVDIGGLQIQI